MKMMINFLLLVAFLMTLSCTIGPTAGGGSDLPDMKIAIGMIYNSDNSPAPQVQVCLIPGDYNGMEDTPIPDSLVDTTDQSGIYSFTIAATGAFNVQAVHLIKRTRAFVPDISLRDDDTTYIPQGVLKEAGALQVILPDTVDTVNGYLYIEGTTEYKSLTAAIPLAEGGYAVTFDSVPEATFPSILYDIINDPQQPILICDTVLITPNDTSVTEAFVFWAHYQRSNADLPHNMVQTVALAPDGALWFGTYNGVARFDGSEWTVYNAINSGLVYNDVIEIQVDKDGVFWFSTLGGAASFDGATWTTYTVANSQLPDDFVTGIVKDNQGNVWFGTWGGIAKYDGVTWTIYNAGNSDLFSDTITYLTIDKNDNIWFSSYHGAGMFDGSTWTIYDSLNSSFPINQACRVQIDSRGRQWFGHCVGIVTMFDGTSWYLYDSNSSAVLQVGHFYDIMEDAEGNIWFGNEWGLTKFDGQTWHDFIGDKYKLLENQIVYSIVIDNDHNKWVGTFTNGVIAFGPTVK